MSKMFLCPICKREVDLLVDFGKNHRGEELRLMNKRYHMVAHKKLDRKKRKLEILKEKVALLEESIEKFIEFNFAGGIPTAR